MPVLSPRPMPDFQRTIERFCGRLVAMLQQDEQANVSAIFSDESIEQFDAIQKKALFRELLRIEVDHRLRLGLPVDPTSYEQQFESYRDVIREVFVMAAPSHAAHPDDDGATVGFDGTEPQQFPVTLASRFTNLRFHARGGLGEVFRAHDESLHRDVAVKFIRPVRAAEQSCREQFLKEGEITGRLDHPGIVPVYGLGETFDNRVFLAMRFIDGRTFREVIDAYHADPSPPAHERRREFNRLLHHLVVACNVIAYAHSRGILHRDIKPENIMIGRFSETLVVDWGLAVPIERDERAKASGEQTIHVASGSGDSRSQPAAGTIGYLSPESLASDSVLCGPRSDIYSLGGTLYYLLTGRRSVSGGLSSETLSSIRTGSFPSPRTVDRDVPRALDAICRKSMDVDPAARYSSPLEMAADIEAFIEDEPVSVLRETLFERCRRTARHHRGIVLSMFAGVVAVAVVGFLSGVWLKQQAVRERKARQVAEQAELEGVKLAANFAAQSVALEIDLRWRILEAMAADPELRTLLAELGDGSAKESEGRQAELRRWLQDRAEQAGSVEADSWFILNALGKQVARKPYEVGTINKSFAARDYFHGQGRHLGDEEIDSEPLQRAHFCRAYTSSSDHSLKVAYSVPVWPLHGDATNSRPIGVLALTAKAGQFSILHRGLSPGQVGVLIDTRGDKTTDERFDENYKPGLVLHHPELDRIQEEKIAAAEDATPVFQAPEIVERLVRIQEVASKMDKDVETQVEADYVDTLWPDRSTRWIAAFKPVVIASRPKGHPEQRYPGLIVMVQLCTKSGGVSTPPSVGQDR